MDMTELNWEDTHYTRPGLQGGCIAHTADGLEVEVFPDGAGAWLFGVRRPLPEEKRVRIDARCKYAYALLDSGTGADREIAKSRATKALARVT